MADSAPESPKHIPQLDAVRGLACLMVLLAHLTAVKGFAWVPALLAPAGVALFFALSGFLITRILIADRAAGRGLNCFYNRRAARIFPIYYLVLAILAVTWPGKELLWAATFTFNFQYVSTRAAYFQFDAVNPVPPIAHFWSLCVEEHFYWFWPALVAFLPRRVYRLVPLAVIAATPLLTWWVVGSLQARRLEPREIQGLVARLTMTQLLALSIGALAAIHERRLATPARVFRVWLPLSLITGIVLVLGGLSAWRILVIPDYHQLPPELWQQAILHIICGGAFLVGLSCPWLARWRLLRRTGTISYGLYLYHLPIYASLGLAESRRWAPIWYGPLALLLTALAALLSYRVLEAPLLRWARRHESAKLVALGRQGLSAGTLATLVIATLAGVVLSSADELAPLRNYDVAESLSQSLAEAFHDPEAIDTVVLGTSHAHHGIATPMLPGMAVNLASGGQDLEYNCDMAEVCLKELPSLKRVIFTLSYFSFQYMAPDWHEQYRKKFKDVDLDELRGWSPMGSAQPVKQAGGKLAAERHAPFMVPAIAQKNKDRLINIIQKCQSKGVKVLLVSTPTHACFYQNLPEPVLRENEEIAREIFDATGLPILDYSRDNRFTDEEFFDPDHLNRNGATHFTSLLIEEALKVD